MSLIKEIISNILFHPTIHIQSEKYNKILTIQEIVSGVVSIVIGLTFNFINIEFNIQFIQNMKGAKNRWRQWRTYDILSIQSMRCTARRKRVIAASGRIISFQQILPLFSSIKISRILARTRLARRLARHDC